MDNDNVTTGATNSARRKSMLVVVAAAVSGVAKAVTTWLLDRFAG